MVTERVVLPRTAEVFPRMAEVFQRSSKRWYAAGLSDRIAWAERYQASILSGVNNVQVLLEYTSGA